MFAIVKTLKYQIVRIFRVLRNNFLRSPNPLPFCCLLVVARTPIPRCCLHNSIRKSNQCNNEKKTIAINNHATFTNHHYQAFDTTTIHSEQPLDSRGVHNALLEMFRMPDKNVIYIYIPGIRRNSRESFVSQSRKKNE